MYAGLFWNRQWRYISCMLAYFGTENGDIYHVGWPILNRMEIYIMYAGLFWNRQWRYISCMLAYFGTENGVIYHVGWPILEQGMVSES